MVTFYNYHMNFFCLWSKYTILIYPAGMSHYPICLERSIFFMLMVLYMLFLLMLFQAWLFFEMTGMFSFFSKHRGCKM